MEEREMDFPGNKPTTDPVVKESSTESDVTQLPNEGGSTTNSGSWSWGSFLQKATTDATGFLVGKSVAMVEFMKKDLNEFTETMQKDTTIIMNDATQSLKEKITMEEANKAANLVKSGISSFFGSINASLAMFDDQCEPDNGDNQQQYQSRSQARLGALLNDLNTFKKEPPGRPEEFEAWLFTFDINKYRAQMNHVLDSNDTVQEAYNKLVPSIVTHNEFWQRYFYRVHQLEKEERRIQSMMARSGEQSPEDLDWGDELDDATSMSQSLLMEVESVTSNSSFQMVTNEPVIERDCGDTVIVGQTPESSPSSTNRHKKKESSGSLGDWDHGFEDPVDPMPSRTDTPTRD